MGKVDMQKGRMLYLVLVFVACNEVSYLTGKSVAHTTKRMKGTVVGDRLTGVTEEGLTEAAKKGTGVTKGGALAEGTVGDSAVEQYSDSSVAWKKACTGVTCWFDWGTGATIGLAGLKKLDWGLTKSGDLGQSGGTTRPHKTMHTKEAAKKGKDATKGDDLAEGTVGDSAVEKVSVSVNKFDWGTGATIGLAGLKKLDWGINDSTGSPKTEYPDNFRNDSTMKGQATMKADYADSDEESYETQ